MSSTPTAAEIQRQLEELLTDSAGASLPDQEPLLLADPLRFRFQLAGGELGCHEADRPPYLAAASGGLLAGAATASWKIALAYRTAGVARCLWWAATLAGTGIGLLTAGIVYVGILFWQERRQDRSYQIPRYLSAPLDIVASSVAYLLLSPAVYASRAAGGDEAADAAWLRERLSREWGFHPHWAEQFVQELGQFATTKFPLDDYRQLSYSLASRCPEVHQPHLQESTLAFLQDLPSGAGRTPQALALRRSLQNCPPAGKPAGQTRF